MRIPKSNNGNSVYSNQQQFSSTDLEMRQKALDALEAALAQTDDVIEKSRLISEFHNTYNQNTAAIDLQAIADLEAALESAKDVSEKVAIINEFHDRNLSDSPEVQQAKEDYLQGKISQSELLAIQVAEADKILAATLNDNQSSTVDKQKLDDTASFFDQIEEAMQELDQPLTSLKPLTYVAKEPSLPMPKDIDIEKLEIRLVSNQPKATTVVKLEVVEKNENQLPNVSRATLQQELEDILDDLESFHDAQSLEIVNANDAIPTLDEIIERVDEIEKDLDKTIHYNRSKALDREIFNLMEELAPNNAQSNNHGHKIDFSELDEALENFKNTPLKHSKEASLKLLDDLLEQQEPTQATLNPQTNTAEPRNAQSNAEANFLDSPYAIAQRKYFDDLLKEVDDKNLSLLVESKLAVLFDKRNPIHDLGKKERKLHIRYTLRDLFDKYPSYFKDQKYLHPMTKQKGIRSAFRRYRNAKLIKKEYQLAYPKQASGFKKVLNKVLQFFKGEPKASSVQTNKVQPRFFNGKPSARDEMQLTDFRTAKPNKGNSPTTK